MVIVNMHEARAQLSKLVERARRGEEIVIARAGQPVARLVPLRPARPPRPLGLYRGQIEVAPDFDTLPEQLLGAFEGSED
ncbi:MAG: type II toxin-antitoxin system prevent-host-death family antitoxin [Planctomycetota bacterium]|nr:MAG: type II toxin-antitoxin system prevent-host-death family antitoxin [Planctomycetota bacterium]